VDKKQEQICFHQEWIINEDGELACRDCGMLFSDAIMVIEISRN